MQPIPNLKQWEAEFTKATEDLGSQERSNGGEKVFAKHMFIEASHVQFLESAGARVVPIDFTMKGEQLNRVLRNLNGVYIPGDQQILVQDPDSE